MRITKKQQEIYFEKVYDDIKKYGFHITSILEEENVTPYSYSTGLFENFKIPELFISGLGPNFSTELIEKYVEKYKFGEVPKNKKITDLTERFPIYLIEINTKKIIDYALTSKKYYENREFKYLQLVFPDLNTRFPNENGYNYDQKILGKF